MPADVSFLFIYADVTVVPIASSNPTRDDLNKRSAVWSRFTAANNKKNVAKLRCAKKPPKKNKNPTSRYIAAKIVWSKWIFSIV